MAAKEEMELRMEAMEAMAAMAPEQNQVLTINTTNIIKT